MADASALLPVVMGVGLATLTASHPSGSSDDGGRPRRHAALFTLAVQLIGFALAGVALFIVAWSVERGQPLGPGDLKAENWFIGALALLIVIVVIRNAWSGFGNSSPSSPWDRGLLDQANTVIMFLMSIALLTALGMCLDLVLFAIGASKTRPSGAIAVIAGLFIVVFGLAAFMVRRLLGADPSPVTFTMARRQQQSLLRDLDVAAGSWVAIRIETTSVLEPALAFFATVWSTDRGLYWRPDDAHSLARYHSWAGNHARIPVAALHLQRISVVAGKLPDSMRGMRITKTTRRLWWIDARRTHRGELPLVLDAGSPERRVGLVHIAYEQLEAAGLVATVSRVPLVKYRSASRDRPPTPPGARRAPGWAAHLHPPVEP